MANFREILKELRPHVLWDAIKYVGISCIAPAAIALWQWTHNHLNILLIIAAFGWSLIMLIIGILLGRKMVADRFIPQTAIQQIEKAGKLHFLAGQASWLAREVEKLWYEFDKNQRKLIYPLTGNEIPDEIKLWTDKLLMGFHSDYQMHIGAVRSVDAECDSVAMKEGFPCNGQDYVTVKRKIEEHADCLQKRADELLRKARWTASQENV